MNKHTEKLNQTYRNASMTIMVELLEEFQDLGREIVNQIQANANIAADIDNGLVDTQHIIKALDYTTYLLVETDDRIMKLESYIQRMR